MASRGISDSGFGGGKSSIKEACQRRNPLKRNQINYQKQLDSMQESLNKDVQENIFPYWRNHNSLKGNASLQKMTGNLGWCGMNYPSIVTNPLLKKHQ